MSQWYQQAGGPSNESSAPGATPVGGQGTPPWTGQSGGNLDITGTNPIVTDPIAGPSRPRRGLADDAPQAYPASPVAMPGVPDASSGAMAPGWQQGQAAYPGIGAAPVNQQTPTWTPTPITPTPVPPAVGSDTFGQFWPADAATTAPSPMPMAAPSPLPADLTGLPAGYGLSPASAAAPLTPPTQALPVQPAPEATAQLPVTPSAPAPKVAEAAPVDTTDSQPADDAQVEPADGGGKAKTPSGKAPKQKKHGRHRVAKVISIIVVCLLVALGVTVAAAYTALNGRLNQFQTGSMVDGDRPSDVASQSNQKSAGDPFAGKAMNILVIGSDSRQGTNSSYTGDHVGGQRSDTTFILHVSADRTRIDALSIPRDILITIPQCVHEDGSKVSGSGASHQKFNAAFAYGAMGAKGTLASGVACSIKAVEAMTNVHIDGSVVVDFTGFASIVDAIGGVDIYLPCAVKAPKADHLDLPKGVNHLNGKLATSYARARTGTGLGDGSDLMRIQRQQALFEAIAKKVMSMNYFTSIGTLYGFVGSVADAVTTDLGSLAGIAGFGFSLRNFDMNKLSFAMVPVGSAGDGSNVIVSTSAAKPYFEALANDTPMPVKSKPSSTPTSSASGSGAPPGVVSAPVGQCH